MLVASFTSMNPTMGNLRVAHIKSCELLETRHATNWVISSEV